MVKKKTRFYEHILIGLMIFLIILQIIRASIVPFRFDYLTISILAGIIILDNVDRLNE